MSSTNPPPPPPGQGGKGKTPIRQAPEVPSGSNASSLAPTAEPLQANPEAQIVVVLIHGLNSSPDAFIGADGSSWATTLDKDIAPLIGNKQVEVVQVGWQTQPLSPANTSLNITDTTPFLLDAIAAQVRGRQWVAVGHSMGGMEILAAMGTAFAETTQTGGNPKTSSAQRIQSWGALLNGCLGIFRLASPGQGSPWGQFGLILSTVAPHANPGQVRGLVINSTESQNITKSSNAWFESRQKANRTVNIVDYDGSAFNISSTRLTKSLTVKLPGETHTSAPKAPAGSPTANVLVAGVVFCVTGEVPQGVNLTPGETKRTGIAGTIGRRVGKFPGGGTLKRLLPGTSGAPGSSSGQPQEQNPEEDPEQDPQQGAPPTS
ncbi:uncharacterized protein Z520_06046 [Fonsecaea multimorphosa CBS 102226]|uniref:Uncharacterized protein n=1 Tax=Fonsecaea multimorphosa CBS 102226 TaxID=1442371 RepID=A0A0D2KMS2_9EURO|nr:uncharacterized protein Z520_06046 [Fonsecaea multimorphosa CBS 102226]KIX97968.1 hypothetical protein Z520_06046 [Fonsecaea multimorphosa CBS 102226]